MTKIIGRLCSVGLGKESSRGTAVAPGKWIPWTKVDYNDEVNLLDNEASIARLEDTDDHALALIFGSATLASKIKDLNFGYLLLSLFGTDTPTARSAPNAAVYDHVFTVAQTVQHQSLSVALKDANYDVVMANSVVDTLKISCKYGDYAMFEAGLTGKASASASNTVSIVAENDFFSKHLTFKMASTQSGLAAASAVKIREFSLEFGQKVMIEEVLGQNTPNDILNGSWGIKGSFTVVHNDTSYNALLVAGTKKALRFDFQNTDVTIGSSANPGLTIDLHSASIVSVKTKRDLNGLVEETIEFRARYSKTDSKMATVTLSNTISAY